MTTGGEKGARTDAARATQTFVTGTRGSALARWQTDHVTQSLQRARRERGKDPVHVEERVITTRGDVDLTERLQGKLEKGFFTAELEAALRAGAIDWAVHSLKDLPTRSPVDLAIGAVLERATPADWLLVAPAAVSEEAHRGLPLIDGARVGTSSLRREALIHALHPGARPMPLRGNVPTRLEKLLRGDYDAIVLAGAGLSRLGLALDGVRVFSLDPRSFPPAPGQGAVAVQCRAGDDEVGALLADIDHALTRLAVERERAFLRVLEGGCSTPFGCYVAPDPDAPTAHLGMLVHGRWRTRTAPLPGFDAPLPDDAIHGILASLTASPEILDERTARTDVWRPL